MITVSPLGGKTLEGKFITLEPLEERHHQALIEAAADASIWTYIPLDLSKGFAPRLAGLVQAHASGQMIIYVVRRRSDGAVVGSTSYLNIAPFDGRVEIGATWYVQSAQGGAVNPEAKYLLLSNAFGAQYNRVEFKTDSKNSRSRAALKKLGAKEEGILRAHMWMTQGYFRDSVYFSILAAEWPALKTALETRLGAF